MMKALKIIHVVGARPNFIKIASIMRACSEVPEIESLLVHTGQHYSESMRSSGLISVLESLPNMLLTEPLAYLDFLKLMSESNLVITDSGGIQEETTMLGVPCLTVRENTEDQ